MDLAEIKNSITTNVYHIPADKKVALHAHPKHDEVFYCIKGEGFGVLEDRDVRLVVGEVFTVRAGIKHALRSDGDLYVTSFLIPVLE